MRFTFKEPKVLPAQLYQAALDKYGEDEGKWGTQLRLTFKIISPEKFAGERISMWVGLTTDLGERIDPRPSNKLGRTLTALNGGPIDFGMEIDLESYVGRNYTIVLAQRNDKTVIESISAPIT